MLREPVEEALGPMPEATLDDVPMQRAVWYATRDADATIRIAPILESMIAAEGLAEVSEIDHAIIPMIDRMQYIGMPVDAAALKRLEDKCTDRMNQVHYAIYQATGADINPDSHDQVRALLFGQLKLPTKELKLTKITKEASTNDKNLERLIRLHPVVGLIQDYREASKVRGTFAIGVGRQVQADGRVHPNLRITRVSSGRLAASNPNLLAIPVRSEIGKEVRDCFVAPDGRILASHDLDQIEMRLMMWESGDPVGIAAFLSGKDIHTETAATMFGISVGNVNKELHRKPGKIVGFGIINGISAHGLVDQMALYRAYKADGSYWTEDDCERMIKAWFGIYRQVPVFMEAAAAEARRYGRVRDRWGRLRYLPAIHSSIERMREEAARQATSHKIQAGAQGIMKIGMAKCWRAIREIWRREGIGAVEPLLQIHDELIVELQERPDLQEEWERTAIGCLTGKGDSRMQWMEILAKGGFNHSWGKLKD
jgi:DNA polymerase-1